MTAVALPYRRLMQGKSVKWAKPVCNVIASVNSQRSRQLLMLTKSAVEQVFFRNSGMDAAQAETAQ